MFCSECGKLVADNAKFCGECGAVQASVAPVQPSRSQNNIHNAEADKNEYARQAAQNYSAGAVVKTPKKNYLLIIVVVVIVLLIRIFGGKGDAALDEFKKTAAGVDMYNCVGAAGVIDWSSYSSKEYADNIRVIGAKMKKGDKSFEVQYLYNVDTKVFELLYLSDNGKPTSKLEGSLQLAAFCPEILF